jgi:tRNA nucleotidyltransferase (CCA-adding enzyme)
MRRKKDITVTSPSADRLSAGKIPIAVREICLLLHNTGHQAWLVGGAVRDIILGKSGINNWDIATDALPGKVQKLFPRSVPTGIQHGTITVFHGECPVEITTFRADETYVDGRHPTAVRFGVTLEEDLARRDFTINALAYDPLADRLEDPYDGMADMERGLVRTVGEALARFREDGLRPMRACRFVAQLGYALEEETARAIPRSLDVFAMVAAERIGDEMDKIVLAPKPSLGIEALRETGLLPAVLPELMACYGVMQNRFHAYDIYMHSVMSCDHAPGEKPAVRWAALLHDLGKVPTRRELPNGEATFYDHQLASARIARTVLTRLKRPTELISKVMHLIREHMFAYSGEWTDAAVRRFMRKVGMENLADLFDLRIADWFGNGTHRGFPQYLNVLLRRIHKEEEKAAALKVTDLAIGGIEVMEALGIPPSPPIGKCLNWLLDHVLDDPAVNERERLLELVREWNAQGRPEAATEDAIPSADPDDKE